MRAVPEDDVEQDGGDVAADASAGMISVRAAGSIIGCGRPFVYSSSPRSRQICAPAGAGSPRSGRSGMLEWTGPSARLSTTCAW